MSARWNMLNRYIVIIFATGYSGFNGRKWFIGCEPKFEVNVCQILKVATNKTITLHSPICTRLALKLNNNNDQQFNRHDFLIKFSPII